MILLIILVEEVYNLSINESTMQQIVIDYYRVFRIYHPYRQFSEKRKLNKIKLISRNNLLISQTEINYNIDYQEYFKKQALPGYKSGLTAIETKKLEIFLSNQLFVAARLQTYYSEFTSEAYSNRIHSFLLHPIKYYLNDDKKEVNFINVQLKIYEHGVAILSFTVNETEGLEIQNFVHSNNDIKINSAYYPKLLFKIEKGEKINQKTDSDDLFRYKKVGRCESIKAVIDRYGDIIQTFLKEKNCPKYFIPYESYYIANMSDLPYEFNLETSDNFKRNIVQLMDGVPFDLYTNNIVENKYSYYKYGHFALIETFSNQHRSINVLSEKIIEDTLEKLNQNEKERQKAQDFEILSQMFDGDQLEEVIKYINYDNAPTVEKPLSLYLILLTDMKSNIFFILEFMLMERLAIVDYNQNFQDVFISESKLLDLELHRFYDWRNANMLANSTYHTTVEMFNWLIERTEDVDKMRIIEYNREFSKEISVQKREVTREKLNIILSILSFLISIVFSFEPISLLLELFEITKRDFVFRWYGAFNSIVLILIILIFKKEILRFFKETKFGYWLQDRITKVIIHLSIFTDFSKVKISSLLQSIRTWFNRYF